jgi:hypothetical protein
VAAFGATADMPPQERGANWIKRSDEVRRNALTHLALETRVIHE